MFTQSSIIRRLALILACVLAVTLAAGCGGKKTKSEDDDAIAGDDNALGDSDSGRAMGLQTIHFPYDSYTLEGEAKTKLKENAKILKDNKGVQIQIEGHCDSRGGIQYNIALGEKRAGAVKKYLQSMGIADSRVTTISYGKERLIEQGDSEEAHAKNRRANFAITTK